MDFKIRVVQLRCLLSGFEGCDLVSELFASLDNLREFFNECVTAHVMQGRCGSARFSSNAEWVCEASRKRTVRPSWI